MRSKEMGNLLIDVFIVTIVLLGGVSILFFINVFSSLLASYFLLFLTLLWKRRGYYNLIIVQILSFSWKYPI